MKLVQRLTIGGLTLIAAGALLVPNAGATTAPPWGTSWCSGSTWTGQFGINNDDPYVATVTALSVTNGVTLSGVAVGSTIGEFKNSESVATGLPLSLASFTVTITLAWPIAANIAPLTRTQVVAKPADCALGETSTTVATSTSTAASTTAASTSTTATTAVSTTAATTPDSTSATTAAQTSTTAARATTTASAGSGTGSSPTVLAAVQTVKLPVTGKASGRVSLLAAATIVAGVLLVSISNIGRPAATDKRR